MIEPRLPHPGEGLLTTDDESIEEYSFESFILFFQKEQPLQYHPSPVIEVTSPQDTQAFSYTTRNHPAPTSSFHAGGFKCLPGEERTL